MKKLKKVVNKHDLEMMTQLQITNTIKNLALENQLENIGTIFLTQSTFIELFNLIYFEHFQMDKNYMEEQDRNKLIGDIVYELIPRCYIVYDNDSIYRVFLSIKDHGEMFYVRINNEILQRNSTYDILMKYVKFAVGCTKLYITRESINDIVQYILIKYELSTLEIDLDAYPIRQWFVLI